LIHAVHLLSFKEERNSYFRSWGGALPFRTHAYLGCSGLSIANCRRSFSKRNPAAKSNAWVFVTLRNQSINLGGNEAIFKRIPNA